MKIFRKDIEKEQPKDHERCLISPHCVIAEFQEGKFFSTNGKIMYMGVTSYILYTDILEHVECKTYKDDNLKGELNSESENS